MLRAITLRWADWQRPNAAGTSGPIGFHRFIVGVEHQTDFAP